MFKFYFVLFFSFQVFSCELFFEDSFEITPPHGGVDLLSFKNENCNEETLKKISTMIGDFSGEIEISHLEKILSSEINTSISISANSGIIKFIQPLANISNEKSRELNTEGYEAIDTINPFTENLKPLLFKKVFVKSNEYLKPFSDMKNIHFYRTNKRLKAGQIINESDLVPLTLVKAGNKTEIIFTNENITLKTYGIARQHGGMNDVIEVYNQTNQKKYLGRIIENNKVEVKL
jgi:flagella basal body P-ring formation protein FlgA